MLLTLLSYGESSFQICHTISTMTDSRIIRNSAFTLTFFAQIGSNTLLTNFSPSPRACLVSSPRRNLILPDEVRAVEMRQWFPRGSLLWVPPPKYLVLCRPVV